MKTITKCYTISTDHAAIISKVAKENGASSDSAALRFIIEEYLRLTNNISKSDQKEK
jgi:hypothetical protein